jgi:hypothetical protein
MAYPRFVATVSVKFRRLLIREPESLPPGTHSKLGEADRDR